MATLFDIIVGNSSLPAQAGNTIWDHLNNQAGGGGGSVQFVDGFDVSISNDEVSVSAEKDLSMSIGDSQISVSTDDENKVSVTDSQIKVTIDDGAEVIVGGCNG